MTVAERETGGLMAAPLVDATMLDGLRAALGPATDTLVARAQGILDDRLEKLDALGPTPLEDQFARLAHEIGGVAGQIGLARLAKAALALEQHSRSGDAAAAGDALVGLRGIASETRLALAS
jgi:HPt (histidine-containing phosphotransfer) domain-containing protein